MRFPGWGSTTGVREAAVAGRFYAGRMERLGAEVDGHLEAARAAGVRAIGDGLVGVIAPHAGHVYSGPIAGYAYASIDPARVERVVLLGPAHFVPVDGIGLSTARAWETPLGTVDLDTDLVDDLRQHFDSAYPADSAHAPEHSLEVQVPFLQRVLRDRWRLVPLLVGSEIPDEVAAVIARCAAMPRTLIVLSTDLSHYLDYDSARARDARTIRAIVDREVDGIGSWDACGRHPLRGLLAAARRNDWHVRLLDARNSGDTAGDRDRVVGYAAFAVTERAAASTPGPASASAAAGQVGAGGDSAGSGAADAGPAPGGTGSPGAEGGTAAVGSVGAPGRIPPAHRAALLALARRTIEDALATGRRPVFDPHAWDRTLLAPGAAFVTLRSAEGELLGCIGSLVATRSLVADVAEHAYDAAFRDPRFPPMSRERAEGMVIDISVLSPTRPFDVGGYDDLVARIPRGTGLVVDAGRRRATFLPAVWTQLPEPRTFVAALWRKAGLAPGEWPEGTTIEVYDSEEFAEQ